MEVELAALATIAASPAPPQRYDETERKGSPELPFHLQSSPSPTPSAGHSPSPSPKVQKRIKITKEDYECGTLNFLAGGHEEEEEEEREAPKKTVEPKATPLPPEKSSTTVVACEDDPMDCSTLVAMAVMNSVDEEDVYPARGNSPRSPPVETVDRATSPTLPAHLVLPPEIANANANNSNAAAAAVESKEEIEAMKKEEEKEARARLHAQYRLILQDKRLKRTGSFGSNDSRLSLSSSLSLIPESVPASRRVGDELSNEFPLAQSAVTTAAGGVSASEEPTKRVSFQDQSPSPSPVPAGELRPIGRPLPSRLLPPIGTDTSVYGMDALVSPRSGSRPLPPLVFAQ